MKGRVIAVEKCVASPYAVAASSLTGIKKTHAEENSLVLIFEEESGKSE
jgi:hypothetical protein